MVQHIVGAHMGRISVESELGKGATFRIWLPAVVQSA
jgi:signal transduction histidine kinase